MEQLSFDNNDKQFNIGAEVGFKTGVSFAIQEMQKFFTAEELFDSLISRIWLAFLKDSQGIMDEINKARQTHYTTIIGDFFMNPNSTAVKDNPDLPTHYYINERQRELAALKEEQNDE